MLEESKNQLALRALPEKEWMLEMLDQFDTLSARVQGHIKAYSETRRKLLIVAKKF